MLFVPGDAGRRGGCATYSPWNKGKDDSSISGDILNETQLARDAEQFASAAVQAIDTGDEVRLSFTMNAARSQVPGIYISTTAAVRVQDLGFVLRLPAMTAVLRYFVTVINSS